MQLHKKTIGLVAGLALLVPFAAQAAGLTSDQVNAVVNLLQSFNVDTHTISTVQAVLNHTGTGSTTNSGDMSVMPPGLMGRMACVALTRNLGPGSHGDDVRKLQDLLHMDPSTGFTASSTGVFGPMTEKAIVRFQMVNGIASSTTGTVGPMTRGFLERACGKGLDGGMGEDHRGPGPTGSTTPWHGDDHASSTSGSHY